MRKKQNADELDIHFLRTEIPSTIVLFAASFVFDERARNRIGRRQR